MQSLFHMPNCSEESRPCSDVTKFIKERARTKTKRKKLSRSVRSNSTLHLMKSLRTEINVEVSDLEYKILRLMMQHPGKIFSTQNIYESVWREPYFYTCGNTVMVHIRKLRTKIEPDPQKPQYIKTVWGKGYRFEDATVD